MSARMALSSKMILSGLIAIRFNLILINPFEFYADFWRPK